MADKAIGDLTAATKPDGTETLHALQGANSRGLTARQITEIGSSIVTDATTARVLTVADVGKWISFTNSGAIICTINTGIFVAGDEIAFEQFGSGAVTFTAGGGFTLGSAGSLIISNGSRSVQGLKFLSATTATLFGNLV